MLILFILIIIFLGSSYFTHQLFFNIFDYKEMLISLSIGLGVTILFFILSVLLLILIFILDKKHNRKYKYFLLYHYFTFVIKVLRVKIKVEGKNNIPNHPFVVYSNHKSMLDVIILFIAYKTVLSAVSKSGVFKVPLIKHIMKSCAIVKIDRENDREGVKELLRGISLVKEGFSYIIFPEGGIKTRETEKIIEQRPGAYKLATKANAFISPASVIGTSKIATRRFFKKMHIKVLIHKPIGYKEYEELNTQHLQDVVKDIINKGIEDGKIA